MTSRGTWRRASRWNRALFLLLAASACAAAVAQTADRVTAAGESPGTAAPVAVLLTPPAFQRGIDVLSPNTVPHWFADYQAEIDGETRTVQVIFVDRTLGEPRLWPGAPCRLAELRVSPAGVYYYEGGEWSLLVLAGDDGATPFPVPCEFVDRFVARFLFFRAAVAGPSEAGRAAPPEFPAILTRAP